MFERPKIFVSYATEDYKLVGKEFLPRLVDALAVRKLGYEDGQIFVDLKSIRAGNQWETLIGEAVKDRPYFVLLVTPRSLASRWCLPCEARAACEHGRRIIPVLVEQDGSWLKWIKSWKSANSWEKAMIPLGGKDKPLKDFQTVPKDPADKTRFLPVLEWQNPDEGWERVAQEIVSAIEVDFDEPSTVPQSTVYYCNQDSVLDRFRLDLASWGNQCLFLFLEGTPEDDLGPFWERLRDDDFKGFLNPVHRSLSGQATAGMDTPARGGLRQAQKLFRLPLDPVDPSSSQADRASTSDSGADLALLHNLSEALVGNCRELSTRAAIAAHIRALDGIHLLHCSLTASAGRRQIEALNRLAELLNDVPGDWPKSRLVFVFTIERPHGSEKAPFAPGLSFASAAVRSLVLPPLEPFGAKEMEEWPAKLRAKKLPEPKSDRFQIFVDDRRKNYSRPHFRGFRELLIRENLISKYP